MKTLPSLLLLALFATPLPGFAQQATATPAAAPAKDPDPDPAMLRAMKSKIFEIKHRHPTWLANSLRVLGSGVRGARIDSNDQNGLNTISVRDFPENLATIEEALKRLDMPSSAQKAPDVELTLHVLFASKSPAGETTLPVELHEVVKQLKNTLAFRGYTLAASFVQRTQIQEDGRSDSRGLGHVLPNALGTPEGKEAPRMKVEWGLNGLKLDARPEGTSSYQVASFWLDLNEEAPSKSFTLAKFRTSLSLKEGERVVVGTSVVKDHGIIVVLTARRVN